MTLPGSPISLSVHHESWIRQQIRDLVLHLDAPVETAELLQVGLISLVQTAVYFDWNRPGPAGETEAAFLALARERIKSDMVDEVRQMTHLSRLQRRRWTLVKLAREHLKIRLRIQGQFRDPTPEEVSVVTGLSVTEIDVLHRMARLEPWEPGHGSHQLMELRSLKPVGQDQLRQARDDTHIVIEQLAPLLLLCPHDRLALIQRHFGVSCWVQGKPLLPVAPAKRPTWWSRLVRRFSQGRSERRPRLSTVDPVNLEEVWPRRMTVLLRPAEAPEGSPDSPRSTPVTLQ